MADHIVFTECKMFYNSKLGYWAGVSFSSVDEIDAVIAQLQSLKEHCDDMDAHFHIQSYGFQDGSYRKRKLETLEIMFHSPAHLQDDTRKDTWKSMCKNTRAALKDM